MLVLFRELMWKALRATGVAALFRRYNQQKILIVMYHAVIDGARDYDRWTHLPLGEFAWQVDYLRKHYNLVPLSELILRIRNGAKLPSNTAVITFDDGFQNNYTNAFPVMRELGVPATIFLATGLIDTDTPCWPDDLFLTLRATSAQELNLDDYGLGIFSLESVSARDAACDTLRKQLKPMDTVDKNRILAAIKRDLQEWSDAPPEIAGDFRLLAWREIEEMHASGLIEFGAHTVNHEILSGMPPSEQRREIAGSLTTVRERLSLEHIIFAYPNGHAEDFTSDSKNILREEGALGSVCTIEGLCDPSDDLYELRRIGVGRDTTRQHFVLLCSGFIPWLKSSLSKVGKH